MLEAPSQFRSAAVRPVMNRHLIRIVENVVNSGTGKDVSARHVGFKQEIFRFMTLPSMEAVPLRSDISL